jgi:hypothetical protein
MILFKIFLWAVIFGIFFFVIMAEIPKKPKKARGKRASSAPRPSARS